MEAAEALGRSSPSSLAERGAAGGAGALGGVLGGRRADRPRRRPALRHARPAVLPPRRDRHRKPHPARRLLARDGRGRLQRVGAAALLRRRLGVDAADRDRGVRPALGLRPGGRGDGPRRLPDRRRAAQPPRRPRRRGAGRGQPDAALVLAGGPRLRALLAADGGLVPLLRPRAAPGPPPRLQPAGGSRRRWRWRPTTSPSSRSPPRRPGCCAAAAGRRCAASGSSPSPARCWRRWRSTRCRSATPSGSATRSSSTGSGRRRSPSRSGRPGTSSPARCTRSWRSCRWR